MTSRNGMPSAADQSQWRRDASEFNTLNIDLPKGKLLQSLLRIYIVFNEPNPWIICVLIHDTLKRIQVRRIRKSVYSMWPHYKGVEARHCLTRMTGHQTQKRASLSGIELIMKRSNLLPRHLITCTWTRFGTRFVLVTHYWPLTGIIE
jgi:hypothetical protein